MRNFYHSNYEFRSGKDYLWGALILGCLSFFLFLQGSFSNPSIRVSAQGQDGDGSVTIRGELKQWHKVTLDLAGPWASETGDPNPFTDYRMDVTFTNGSLTYVVPGYFAADGNAAESSATEGNVWRAHLSPDLTGTWSYAVSFKSGDDVAITDSGSALAPYNGVSGSFTVDATDKIGRDLRGKGRLTYVGERYLQFAGSGDYFIKVGADAPENFLNYTEFDGTFNDGGTDYTKNWGPHIDDWNEGDPTWQNGKGTGIIGAVNYLSEQGLNVFSFLTYNVGGDSEDVWPFIDPDERLRYDASKLDQWEIVFEHATAQGMYLHFKTQETENDNGNNALDGGDVDIERKLYYRELIARFGHNLALNWNLGEENSQTDAQRIAMAAYFAENDPYGHNIVIHSYPNQQEQVYRPLLGSNSELTGASLQNSWSDVHDRTLQWIKESADAGKQWVVANDEQGNAQNGIPPDLGYPGYGGGGPNRDELRHEVLWGNLMAGGAGVEAYFGYGHPESDLTADDFRSRASWWADNSRALTFFETYLPFWEMSTCNALIGNATNNDGDGYCLGKSGEIYAIYLPDGGTKSLDLSGLGADSYSVQWYDPRNGGNLQSGNVTQVNGGQSVSIGNPPTSTDLDWVALVERADGPPLPTPTPAPTTAATPTSTPNASALAVVSLTLINADTDQPIKTLDNGETLYLQSLPTTNLNLRADVNNPNNTIGSVRFGLDGQANYQTENVAPYAFAGDTDGDYDPWDLTTGSYTVVATPYTGANGGGTAGQALTVQFTIVNQVEPTPELTATATPVGPTPILTATATPVEPTPMPTASATPVGPTPMPTASTTPVATATLGTPEPIGSNSDILFIPLVLNSAQPGLGTDPPQSAPTETPSSATATSIPIDPSPTATEETSIIPTMTPMPTGSTGDDDTHADRSADDDTHVDRSSDDDTHADRSTDDDTHSNDAAWLFSL